MVHDRERGCKAEYLTIVQDGQMRQVVDKLKEATTATHREGTWKTNFRGHSAENIARKFVTLLRHGKMPRNSDHRARMDWGGWVNLSSITTAMWKHLSEDEKRYAGDPPELSPTSFASSTVPPPPM